MFHLFSEMREHFYQKIVPVPSPPTKDIGGHAVTTLHAYYDLATTATLHSPGGV